MATLEDIINGIKGMNVEEIPLETKNYETEKRGKLWEMAKRYSRKHAFQNQVLDRIINAGNRYRCSSKKDTEKFSRRGLGCSKNIRRRNRRRMLKGELFKKDWGGEYRSVKKRWTTKVTKNGETVQYFHPYGRLYGWWYITFLDEEGKYYGSTEWYLSKV